MTWRSCGLWWYGRRSDPITTPEPDPLMIDAVRDMSMTREMGPQENGPLGITQQRPAVLTCTNGYFTQTGRPMRTRLYLTLTNT